MRAPISVIIPTMNAEAALPACLSALTPGLAAGLIRELILSDGGSHDGTADTAEQAGAILLCGPASRGGQLRRGADAAAGDWLLFLHADSVLAADWAEQVIPLLQRPGAYYGALRFDAPGALPRVVAGWANLRARLFHLPYGDQALLIHRSLYEAKGGYRDMPLMEDVALARALGSALQPMPVLVTTSAEKYHRDGWLRRGARNVWLLLRYLAGAKPEALAAAYRS